MIFYNRVILTGILVEPPDVRYAPSGSQVSKLALQIGPDKTVGEHEPQIVEVIAVKEGNSREVFRFSQGSPILLEGRIQVRSWKTGQGQKKVKLEIIAERIYPLKAP